MLKSIKLEELKPKNLKQEKMIIELGYENDPNIDLLIKKIMNLLNDIGIDEYAIYREK